MAQIMAKKCDFSCNETATLYCKECNQFLCMECRKKVHDKFPKCKDHAVVNIHQEGNCVFRTHPVCETHKDTFVFYCSKCECLTCAECMTSTHNEHKTEKIKIVADARRQNVNQIIQQLKTKVETVKQKLQTIETEHSIQIQSDCESYVKTVEDTVSDLHTIVDRHKLIPFTTASDFKNNETEDLGRKRAFFRNRQDDVEDRLLKFENLLQEAHDSTFLTKWKTLQSVAKINDEETDVPLVAPRRIEGFNQKKLTKSVIDEIDEQFQMRLKEQEMALTKMTEELGELRTQVEIKQMTINEVTKKAADNIQKITTKFEDKLKLLEAELKTSKEDNDKAEKFEKNITKQLSEAIDLYNRERDENTKLKNIILKQEEDLEASRNQKDMKPNIQRKEKTLLLQHDKKSTDTCHENKTVFKLSHLEFNLLQFYCEDSQIFIGCYDYKDGVLMRYLNPTENEACLQTIFKSKMDFLHSLTNCILFCPSKISDEKLYEIQKAVSDTKEIYCERSENKKMITLYSSNYEKMGEGKHKAEVVLGLKQQSRGRRNRGFVTETDDSSSSKKEPTLASGVDQTVKQRSCFSRSLSSSSGPRIEMTFKTSEGIIVKVYNGNILSLDVDCIVNAANENLNHGGGVAYVIAAAAGYDFEKESVDYIQRNGPILEGSCCRTSAGKLKYKSVIHTVGPKWYSYNDKKECCRILRKSVASCFFEAELNRMTSIATPPISAGIFGVPYEVCCMEYGKAVEDFSSRNGYKTCIKEIHFIDKDAGMISMIQKEFSQKFNHISSSTAGSSNSSEGYNAGSQGRISRSLLSPEDQEVAKKEPLNRKNYLARIRSKFQKQFLATKDLKVFVVQDDIINRKVDTIVCPQDENISNKGGIAIAIEKVCDESYKRAVMDIEYVSKSDTRKVKASPSSLPFRYVLHAVPPIYDKLADAYRIPFDNDLETTIRNIMRHCSDESDVTSFAIPVLGIGKDGLETPVLVFAKIFLIVLLEELKFSRKFDIKEIHIVTNDISAAVIIADELGDETNFNSFSRTRKRGKKVNTKPETKMVIAGKSFRHKLEDGSESCIICTEPNIQPRELTCGHIFCKNCVREMLKIKTVCPTCGSIQGVIKGDQPPGTMKRRETRYSLPGYTCGTIEIEYEIFGGVQGEEHQNPGRSFEGFKSVAYLPNNTKGKLIAYLLKIAFDRKLVFTIGYSGTTGQEGVVTWNDIHHKTSSFYGHQFGYPDEGYFDRILNELKVKGVTEKDLKH